MEEARLEQEMKRQAEREAARKEAERQRQIEAEKMRMKELQVLWSSPFLKSYNS